MRICAALIWLSFPCVVALAIGGHHKRVSSTENPPGRQPEVIQAGKLLYENNCSFCHGVKGEGGRGSKLAQSEYVRAMSDRAIFDVIWNGISGTEMMAFPLGDQEIWALVAYIRSLNLAAFQQDVPGDVAAGQALFFKQSKCSSCHMIGGRGGLIGPDLSNIGVERSVDSISESIRDPSNRIELRWRQVQVMTLDGRAFEGLVKNDSTYSIQILDVKGSFRLFLKSELKKIVYRKQSLMPVPDLAEKDFQDLLAFLSRQAPRGISEEQSTSKHGEMINR